MAQRGVTRVDLQDREPDEVEDQSEEELEDILLEEVSIDGMCGVY